MNDDYVEFSRSSQRPWDLHIHLVQALEKTLRSGEIRDKRHASYADFRLNRLKTADSSSSSPPQSMKFVTQRSPWRHW